jgi:hypothetical protein
VWADRGSGTWAVGVLGPNVNGNGLGWMVGGAGAGCLRSCNQVPSLHELNGRLMASQLLDSCLDDKGGNGEKQGWMWGAFLGKWPTAGGGSRGEGLPGALEEHCAEGGVQEGMAVWYRRQVEGIIRSTR